MFNQIYVYYIYFLVYLNVCGINPKEHGVKQELVSLLQMYFTYNTFFWVLVKVTYGSNQHSYSVHPLVVDKGALLMGQGIVRLYYRKSDLGP